MALNEGFEVDLRFLLVGITAGNEVRARFTIRPDENGDAAVEPTQASQALFTLGMARVFFGQHREIENRLTIGKVDAMLGKIGLAFCIRVGRHK